MIAFAVRSSRTLGRAIFLVAALFLALSPSLDAAAHAAARSTAVETHSVMQTLAAFDVIDDVTDHLPGELPKAATQHVWLAVSWPKPPQPLTDHVRPAVAAWSVPLATPLVSATTNSKDDPPRD